MSKYSLIFTYETDFQRLHDEQPLPKPEVVAQAATLTEIADKVAKFIIRPRDREKFERWTRNAGDKLTLTELNDILFTVVREYHVEKEKTMLEKFIQKHYPNAVKYTNDSGDILLVDNDEHGTVLISFDKEDIMPKNIIVYYTDAPHDHTNPLGINLEVEKL